MRLVWVDFENTNQSFDLMFDEDIWTLEGFFDKTKNWFTDRVYSDGVKKKTKAILEPFLKLYEAQYEKPGKGVFRGILLFMTNLPFDGNKDRGGVSQTYPEDARSCIIFKNNLGDPSTYAHEIGHALGLEHSFWQDKEKADFANTMGTINDQKAAIEKRKREKTENEAGIKSNTELVIIPSEKDIEKYEKLRNSPSYPYKKEASEYINKLKEKIADAKAKNSHMKKNLNDIRDFNAKSVEYVQSMQHIFHNNLFKWQSTKTACIMDYSSTKSFYFYFQWHVMQQDVIHFYGHAE